MYLDGVLEYFPPPEGYVRRNPNGTYNYVYQYKAHLGNVRMVYADVNKNGEIKGTELLQEQDYYPFGMEFTHTGTYSASSNSGQKIKFLGQERQEELGLNWDMFRYRNYDYAIGRFFGIDPITEKYMSISPYQFAHNIPVWKVELEGLEGVPTTNIDVINEEPIQIENSEYITPAGRRGTVTVSVSPNLYNRLSNSSESQQNTGSESSKFANSDSGGFTTYRPIFDPPQGFVYSLSGTTEMLIAHDVYQLSDLAMGIGGAAGAGRKMIQEALEKAAKNGPEAVENLGGVLKSAQKTLKGLDDQISQHTKKLEDFVANPDAFDNKGFLKNASPELREKIIKARVQSLQSQIDDFKSQSDDIKNGVEQLLSQ